MLVLTIESSHLSTAYCINLLCVCYLVGIYFSIYLLIFFKCLLNAVFCIQLRVSSLIYVPVYIKHTYVNRIWWNKSSQVENFTLQHQSEPDQVIDTTVTKLNKLISRRIVDCAFLTREQHHSPSYFTGIACHSTSSWELSQPVYLTDQLNTIFSEQFFHGVMHFRDWTGGVLL